jgi:hypothetical protein
MRTNKKVDRSHLRAVATFVMAAASVNRCDEGESERRLTAKRDLRVDVFSQVLMKAAFEERLVAEE